MLMRQEVVKNEAFSTKRSVQELRKVTRNAVHLSAMAPKGSGR